MEKLSVKSLQIGDWVIPHVYDSALEPSKIVGIHYNSYKGKDYVDWVDCEVWDELSLSDIEPIPLTPEILEKNGFYENQDRWWWKDFYITLASTKALTLVCNRTIQFDYVHQLQHALRICGIEKEIEL